MIKAVILDAYGTVFFTGTGSVEAMTEVLRLNGRNDLDPKKVYAGFKKLHREHIDGLTEFLTEAEVFGLDMAEISREYGLTRDPAEDTRVMLSIQGTRTAYADSKAAIERMQRSVPVIIGSTTDTWPVMTDLARAGIVPDKVFTSESMRVYKPQEAFYRTILKELDIEPEEALFAGDSLLDDVFGPQRIGMKTCWITRKGEVWKEEDPRPDYMAKDLAQLADILEEINAFGKAGDEKIRALFRRCGLGEPENIVPVSGGLMHRMYRVQTEQDVYAVKCLNPEIMKRPAAKDNFARAEELESELEENGIPVVPALVFSGRKMQEVCGSFFYIFRWQEGAITDYDHISEEQCRKAGYVLGRIHGIRPERTEPAAPELFEADFRFYLDEAQKRKDPLAKLLEADMDLLEYAVQSLNEARQKLPPVRSICNDDMDPKNVMWHQGEPHVIDLECLDYGNPVSACLDLSLQWAGTATGNFRKENLEAFFKGYLSAYDNGFRAYDELFGISYTWVDWLEYNLRRALGMEGCDPGEIRLGAEEAVKTLDRIRYLHLIENEVRGILQSIIIRDGAVPRS